jgi:hypothetical protein
MSDESADNELERMVEQQARGESAGLPVEESASGAAELDTRRSKSGLASSLFGQGVHVEINAADVDTQAFIAHQTGIDGFQADTGPGQPLATHPPVVMAGGEVDVAYPDAVDRPEWIEAHMRPGLGSISPGDADAPSTAVAQANEPIQAADQTPPPVASDPNQYPDTVDRPDFIAAHGGTGGPADADRILASENRLIAEERTLETEIQRVPPPA